MARISANPNPVGVYFPTVPAATNVEWNSEAAFPVKAVWVVGGVETEFPGQPMGGARSGSGTLEVTFPNTYELILRRSDNQPAEVARSKVTTFDLRVQLAQSFAAAYQPQLQPQAITHLSVTPFVDTVRISFRTTKPTIPRTTLFDETGAVVDARFPLFGGLQTRHQAMFGVERALALEAKHSFEIVAAGPTGNPSSPKEAILRGEFITGRRTVELVFETLDVFDDGDPGLRGSGELQFTFGAGDAETGAPMGEPWPTHGPANISYDDPLIALNGRIAIAKAPRQLWIQVVGQEDDGTIWFPEAGIGFGMRPIFEGAGSSSISSEAAQQSDATIVLEMDDAPGVGTGGFELRTGNFDVAFAVTGSLINEAEHGLFIAPKMHRRGTLPRSSGVLNEPGGMIALATGEASERTEVLARGADGGLYHKAVGPLPDQRGEGWTSIPLPANGTVSAIASGDRVIDLVLHDEAGGVAHRRFDPGKPRSGAWRRLGGKFREVALASGKAKEGPPGPLIFGLAEDGDLYARGADGAGGEWQRVGDRPIRAMAPIDEGRGAPALIGVSQDGSLWHFSQSGGRWRTRDLGARVPGDAQVQAVTAVVSRQGHRNAERELIIGVMTEDHRVRALRLGPDAEAASRNRWEDFGSFQDLWIAEEPQRPTRKQASKSTAEKGRTKR